MGLFGSSLKALTKIALTPVAVAADIATGGGFGMVDGEFLTEKLNRNLGKDFKKISKGIDKL